MPWDEGYARWLMMPRLDFIWLSRREDAVPDDAQVFSLRQFVTMREGFADWSFCSSFLFSNSIFLF